LSAELRKAELKKFSQVTAVRRVKVEHDCSLLCLQPVGRKLRHNLSLKSIHEACAEDVVSGLGNGWIG
jgi:hypothetical protein